MSHLKYGRNAKPRMKAEARASCKVTEGSGALDRRDRVGGVIYVVLTPPPSVTPCQAVPFLGSETGCKLLGGWERP